jgi:hypothetical protein
MPNWVYNGLTVEGSPDSVKKLKEQVGKPISVPVIDWKTNELKIETNDNPIFSYWNIIAPTDLDTYPLQKSESTNGNDWYTWNQTNWGVKWDASNPDLQDEAPNGESYAIHYTFESPWGIPDQALVNLSSQYPDLLFTLTYEEETGWGGEHEYLRGEQLAGMEYNWQCQECDYAHGGDPDELYIEKYEELVCPKCQWPVLELMNTPKEEVK